MGFMDFLTNLASGVEKRVGEIEDSWRNSLSKKSDYEIKRMYDRRFEADVSPRYINLLEEEANRRGIY